MILPSKINWSTFEYKKDTFGDDGTLPGNYKTVYTYTIQNTGVFYIQGEATIYADSTNGAGFMTIEKNGTEIAKQRLAQLQHNDYSGGTTTVPNTVVRLQAGDVIKWKISGSEAFGYTAYYWSQGTITVAQII